LLYTRFSFNNDVVPSLDVGHQCCSYCTTLCRCDTVHNFPFESDASEDDTGNEMCTIRDVTEADKLVIKEKLTEIHQSACSSQSLFVPSSFAGFTEAFVNSVLEHLPYIDSEKYLLSNLNIIEESKAAKVFDIIKDYFQDETPTKKKNYWVMISYLFFLMTKRMELKLSLIMKQRMILILIHFIVTYFLQ
jgi:hypothetical protein